MTPTDTVIKKAVYK